MLLCLLEELGLPAKGIDGWVPFSGSWVLPRDERVGLFGWELV